MTADNPAFVRGHVTATLECAVPTLEISPYEQTVLKLFEPVTGAVTEIAANATEDAKAVQQGVRTALALEVTQSVIANEILDATRNKASRLVEGSSQLTQAIFTRAADETQKLGLNAIAGDAINNMDVSLGDVLASHGYDALKQPRDDESVALNVLGSAPNTLYQTARANLENNPDQVESIRDFTAGQLANLRNGDIDAPTFLQRVSDKLEIFQSQPRSSEVSLPVNRDEEELLRIAQTSIIIPSIIRGNIRRRNGKVYEWAQVADAIKPVEERLGKHEPHMNNGYSEQEVGRARHVLLSLKDKPLEEQTMSVLKNPWMVSAISSLPYEVQDHYKFLQPALVVASTIAQGAREKSGRSSHGRGVFNFRKPNGDPDWRKIGKTAALATTGVLILSGCMNNQNEQNADVVSPESTMTPTPVLTPLPTNIPPLTATIPASATADSQLWTTTDIIARLGSQHVAEFNAPNTDRIPQSTWNELVRFDQHYPDCQTFLCDALTADAGNGESRTGFAFLAPDGSLLVPMTFDGTMWNGDGSIDFDRTEKIPPLVTANGDRLSAVEFFDFNISPNGEMVAANGQPPIDRIGWVNSEGEVVGLLVQPFTDGHAQIHVREPGKFFGAGLEIPDTHDTAVVMTVDKLGGKYLGVYGVEQTGDLAGRIKFEDGPSNGKGENGVWQNISGEWVWVGQQVLTGEPTPDAAPTPEPTQAPPAEQTIQGENADGLPQKPEGAEELKYSKVQIEDESIVRLVEVDEDGDTKDVWEYHVELERWINADVAKVERFVDNNTESILHESVTRVVTNFDVRASHELQAMLSQRLKQLQPDRYQDIDNPFYATVFSTQELERVIRGFPSFYAMRADGNENLVSAAGTKLNIVFTSNKEATLMAGELPVFKYAVPYGSDAVTGYAYEGGGEINIMIGLPYIFTEGFDARVSDPMDLYGALKAVFSNIKSGRHGIIAGNNYMNTEFFVDTEYDDANHTNAPKTAILHFHIGDPVYVLSYLSPVDGRPYQWYTEIYYIVLAEQFPPWVELSRYQERNLSKNAFQWNP